MTSRVVAIDGPSGAGKSTVARGVARRLGLPHIDTGAIYRAATLATLRRGVDVGDPEASAAVARSVVIDRLDGRTHLDGEDVEEEIRGSEVTAAVSTFAAHRAVREAMVDVQRSAAASGGVLEGRDTTTVVFPDADLKIFLTATLEERARRRALELGRDDVEVVAAELAKRDAQDSTREVAPLVQPEDAWEVDTTDLEPEETIDAVVGLARALWREDEEAEEEEGEAEAEEMGGEAETDEAKLDAEEVHPAVTARRALPKVAVVGRPNVGKSTLVNRIVGAREAIVEERPGVTRDRTEHIAEWLGRRFVVVDTGGWEHSPEGLSASVVDQAERAIAEADVVLFVVDVNVGALGDDELYARILRRAERRVLLVANKVDSPRQDPYVHELHGLGLGDPHAVSAAHGRGVGDLLDEVIAVLPDVPIDLSLVHGVPRIAIVGRPNVGKSSLFNRLVGEERSIVDPVPHTTRDSVDTLVELDGEPWVFVDTAGLRRRYRRGEETELYSVDRTRRAVADADLALFVVDGSEPLGEQDQRLAAMLRDAGRGVVLVVNKWDQVDEERRRYLERELDRLLRFMTWAPRTNASALSGRGVARIADHLRVALASYRTRIPTGELNTWLRDALDRVPPPVKGAKRPARVRYITQVRSAPPTFILFTNRELETSYRRYLERELRERYGFVGTPIRIDDRPRGGRGTT